MICIYHSRDLDGWMSAAIVQKYFHESDDIDDGQKLELIGWDYGMDIPDIPDGEKLVITDVSFPIDVMIDLAERCSVTWIDHHVSAIKDYLDNITRITPVIITSFPTVQFLTGSGIEVGKKAACELTWEHFFPGKQTPRVVTLLGAYDTFRHVDMDPVAKETVEFFQYGARVHYSSPAGCFYLLKQGQDEIDQIVLTGESIMLYLTGEAEKAFNHRTDVEIDGHRFAAMNKPFFNPKNFGLSQDGYDGFMAYSYSGSSGLWIVSLYSDTIDCSVIAKSMGGGGHKGAAGFQVEDIQTFLRNGH